MDTKYSRHYNIAALAVSALLAISTADAYEAGDWVLRAGPAGVLVTGESALIPELAGTARLRQMMPGALA